MPKYFINHWKKNYFVEIKMVEHILANTFESQHESTKRDNRKFWIYDWYTLIMFYNVAYDVTNIFQGILLEYLHSTMAKFSVQPFFVSTNFFYSRHGKLLTYPHIMYRLKNIYLIYRYHFMTCYVIFVSYRIIMSSNLLFSNKKKDWYINITVSYSTCLTLSKL